MFKKGLRTLGIDDSPFRFSDDKVSIIGALMEGSKKLERVLETGIEKDGFDATEKIIGMVEETGQKEHLRAVFLDGITFGGLNIADIKEINRRTGIPVLAISSKKPSIEDVIESARELENPEERVRNIRKAGELHRKNGERLWYQLSGTDIQKAEELIEMTRSISKIPEPLRAAHKIASREQF